ncbi:MAG: hypothetical protein ACE5EB_05870, partial [Thermodesulfobacteriota bacterium]
KKTLFHPSQRLKLHHRCLEKPQPLSPGAFKGLLRVFLAAPNALKEWIITAPGDNEDKVASNLLSIIALC